MIMSWSCHTYSIWNSFSIDCWWILRILIEIDWKISEQKCLHISNEAQKTHIELKTCCVWVRVFRVWKRRHVIENLGKVISCNFHHIISVNIHQHPNAFKVDFLSPAPHHHQNMKGVDPFAQMSSIGNEPGIRNVVPTSPGTILAIPSRNPMLQTLPGCIVPINAVQCCYQQSNCRRCLRFQPLQSVQLPWETTKDDCFNWMSHKIMPYLCYSFEE